jgi:GNAT superfamily N-acetyltransferase
LSLLIRAFEPGDAPRVRELFIAVNRLLAPPGMHAEFEAYIERALREEIDRIAEYYREGGFWVALEAEVLLGTFGLEPATARAMELRRMYVSPAARRRGVGRAMLRYAEEEALRRGCGKLTLSTAQIQKEAIALYKRAGYRLVREEPLEPASHKTVGGLARVYFEKLLRPLIDPGPGPRRRRGRRSARCG